MSEHRSHTGSTGQDARASEDDARFPRGFRQLSRRGFLTAIAGGAGALAALSTTGCSAVEELLSGDSAEVSQAEVATITDTESAPTSATLMMVGDMLIHKRVWLSGEQDDGSYNYDHLFAQMADEFGSADIAMVNQETILGGTELGLSGYPLFNSPQEIGDAEAAVGVNVVTAATNHALDQGYTGIEREVDFWETEHPEVTCLGLATSQEMADAINYFVYNDITIAILNYTESTNGISIPSSYPYCVSMLTTDAVTEDVEAAREGGADFVVVVPHWGTEYVTSPTSAQQEWAALFLELGVDVVIGGHPHVIEPVEVLEREDGHRMLVYWSLGNFVSTQTAKARMVGGMAHVTFYKDGSDCSISEYRFEPTITHQGSGTAFTTYLLSEYTEDLATANLIRSSDGCSDFTRSWCVEFCEEVLGEEFDSSTCQIVGSV